MDGCPLKGILCIGGALKQELKICGFLPYFFYVTGAGFKRRKQQKFVNNCMSFNDIDENALRGSWAL